MNQSHYYKAAIDIVNGVLNGETNPHAIIIAIAKSNPKVLCDAAQVTPWELEAKLIFHRDGKVPAIKFIRSKTGLGLKESKDIADKFGDRQ